jgi:dual specificity tyrosine-phosphorylation-regulated kinase 1
VQAPAAPSGYDFPIREGDTLDNGRYVLQGVVGKGSFGQVARATDRQTGALVAIKVVQARKAFAENAKKEVAMLQALNAADPSDARGVVRLKRNFVEQGRWQCLVFEHLSYSLFDLLRNTSFQGVSLQLVRKLAVQVLDAMDFLRTLSPPVIHADIKPENVLLRHPTRSAVKLIDFGSSCREGATEYTYVQSRFYRSPEVMLGVPYGPGVDMWSLGCMLMELHSGEPLFGGRDESDQLWRIAMALGEPPQELLERASHRKKRKYLRSRGGCDAGGAMAAVVGGGSGGWLELVPSNSHSERKYLRKPLHVSLSNARRRATARGEAQRMQANSAARAGSASAAPQTAVDTDEDYDAFLELLSGLLVYDPAQRLSPAQAMQSRFIRGGASAQQGASGSAVGASTPPRKPTMEPSSPPQAAKPDGTLNGMRRTKAGARELRVQEQAKRY